MQTPSSIYRPSPRRYPLRVPDPEYGSGLLVRRVQRHGQFSWKHQDVFLSETLVGERIALLSSDDGCFTIFFAQFPIACFDRRRLRILPLSQQTFYSDEAGEGESPLPLHLTEPDPKVSGMCPV
jgi:hypothetical protein